MSVRPKDLLFDWTYRYFPQERIPPPAERLWGFLEFLQAEARKFNLTAISDMGEMVTRHVLDALGPLASEEAPVRGRLHEALRVIDIGSGNGVPGLVVAVIAPAWRVTLLESNRKKCEFLESAARVAGVDNVEVVCARAEVAARDPLRRDAYDFAMARGLAILPVALELCLPFVGPQGWLLAHKGTDCSQEIANSDLALRELRGGLKKVLPYTVGDLPSQHTAVWVQKLGSTPSEYPRRDGLPKKRPLWPAAQAGMRKPPAGHE